MNDPLVDRLDDHEPLPEPLEIHQPRAVGSPLPRGNGGRVHLPPSYADLERNPPAPQPVPQPGPVLATPPNQAEQPEMPGPVLAPSPAPAGQPEAVPAKRESVKPELPPALPSARRSLPAPAAHRTTGFQRAVGAIRTALPFVQKLLPLLEGNVATAVSNVLAPQPHHPAPAPRPVDLSPIEKSIAELQTRQSDLREQLTEQNTSLKRVEDRLEMVREATDRNTLEQQELMTDLKSMGNRVNLVAAIAIGLLAISLLVNLALLLHIQRVLP